MFKYYFPRFPKDRQMLFSIYTIFMKGKIYTVAEVV